MTPEQEKFIDAGIDFFNNAFSDIPNDQAQEVKAEIIKRLQETTPNTASPIKHTIVSGIKFADAGFHLHANTKGADIADSVTAAAESYDETNKVPVLKLLGLLFKFNKAA